MVGGAEGPRGNAEALAEQPTERSWAFEAYREADGGDTVAGVLGDDEALVITLNPIGARYLAVQLANGWLGSLDYLHHTASLNLAQTRANPDGTVTLVVAARDPGVANWLDTTGLHEGSMFVRWQQLPDTLDPQARGVRDVRLVKLSQLDPSLPRVTPDERRDLVQARAAAYARRFAQ